MLNHKLTKLTAMPTYHVFLPFTGVFFLEVEADSEDAAKDAAFEKDITLNAKEAEIQDWNTHEHVVRGNVFYGVQREIEVEPAND